MNYEPQTTEGRTQKIVDLSKRLDTLSSTRVLSALGHPGYGEDHADEALRTWAEYPLLTLHAAVYQNYGFDRRTG